MTTKNAKAILFASLIAAMILPLSEMNYAVAQETGDLKAEEIQKETEIFNIILELQYESDLVRMDLREALESGDDTDRWIAKGKLVEITEQIDQLVAILKQISPVRETSEFTMTKPGIAEVALKDVLIQYAYAIDWTINDSNNGCSGSLQTWSVDGTVNAPTTTTNLGIDYPSNISIGLWPFCSGTDWSSFGFQVDNITQDWSCIADFDVFSTDDFNATCVGKTMNVGDLLHIYTSGNYDLWALPNDRFYVP